MARRVLLGPPASVGADGKTRPVTDAEDQSRPRSFAERMTPAARAEFVECTLQLIALLPQLRDEGRLAEMETVLGQGAADPVEAAAFLRGLEGSLRRNADLWGRMTQLVGRSAELLEQEFPPGSAR